MGKKKWYKSFGDMKGIGVYAMVIAVVSGFIMFLMLYGNTWGYTPAMVTTLINVMPFIFVGMLSILILRSSANSPVFVIGGFSGVGICIAFLLNALHTEGIFTDAVFLPGTLQGAMLLSVIVCMGLGAVVSMVVSKK